MSISKAWPTIVGILVLLALPVVASGANDYCPDPAGISQPPQKTVLMKAPDDHSWQGYLRVYIVQDSSTHWNDYAARPYRQAFIGFAVNELITISYTDTVVHDIVWTGSDHGFGDIAADNITVIAVLTDNTGHEGYSDPPHGNPFAAYYPQRVAIAKPGETNTDQSSGGFTHTVLLEIGTGSWCQFCPATANGVRNLWLNTGSPAYGNFIYVSLVDSDPTADDWIHSDYFNISGYPTGWTNGGYGTEVGAQASATYWETMVVDAGGLNVADVFLEVSLEWLGSSQIQIVARAAKSGLTNSPPSNPAATPTGDTELFTDFEGTYTTSCDEGEGDQVYFKWVYEEGDTSDWLGPYDSEALCEITHSWAAPGSYDVKVLVKDSFDAEGAWSDPLTVTVEDYTCGDADGNGIVNISDAVFLIAYIFGGGPAPYPELSGDADCNQIVNISDAVFLIAYIFGGGPAPCDTCP